MAYSSFRRRRLILLGLVTTALVVVSWLAMQSITELRNARSQAKFAQAELSQLRSLLPAVQKRERYIQQSDQIRAMIKRIGINPARWANRRIQRTAGVLGRQETAQFLEQQLGGNQQWFVADKFDVSVTAPKAGLFTTPLPDEKGFNFELSGVIYFPLSTP